MRKIHGNLFSIELISHNDLKYTGFLFVYSFLNEDYKSTWTYPIIKQVMQN